MAHSSPYFLALAVLLAAIGICSGADLKFMNQDTEVARISPTGELFVAALNGNGAGIDLASHALITDLSSRLTTLEGLVATLQSEKVALAARVTKLETDPPLSNRVFFNVGSMTWTVPDGVKKIFVAAYGGGGGGTTGPAWGGSAGGYCEKTMAVTAGTTFAISVGSGGIAGGAGTQSTVSVGGTVILSAGGGGVGGTAGGAASGGDINIPGARGLALEGTDASLSGGSAAGPYGSSSTGGYGSGGLGSGYATNRTPGQNGLVVIMY